MFVPSWPRRDTLRCSHTTIGKEILQSLKGWLAPPDPSMNYAIGLRDLHEETATWFLGGRIFREWHLSGSLLWIHGKRTSVEICRLPVPDGSHHPKRVRGRASSGSPFL